MVLRHMQAGWKEADIAFGMEALAREHIASLGGDEANEMIAQARYDAQFDWLTAEPKESTGLQWAGAAGALIWCVLLFSAVFLADWAFLRFVR
ncbi:MAG: hypothetical protein DCC69_10050 [Hyphomicrobiales bacterium]|nr:MAG: hypothetical protein DCC69_10050 [Hyphomicrobiales bacterium]